MSTKSPMPTTPIPDKSPNENVKEQKGFDQKIVIFGVISGSAVFIYLFHFPRSVSSNSKLFSLFLIKSLFYFSFFSIS